MRRFAVELRVMIGLLLAVLGVSYGQSLSLSPTMPYVPVNGTVQFKAVGDGVTNSSVTWYAAGKAGGNAANGTISASGLYTAPATLPGQDPVLITAVSKANSSVKTSTYVNVIPLGPTIASVSPNPLSVGNITVTIQGTGFKSGATVLDTYGGTGVQLVTGKVTATTVTASGWQGQADSATFTVRNPGSAPSNAIIVPISGGTKTYPLTVVSGSGSGSYAAGVSVSISANAPPTGQVFKNWTGATVTNPSSPATTLSMPAQATTVTANYTASNTLYTLTVVNGTGGGNYKAGTSVSITANSPPQGQTFKNWTGAAVTDPNASTTTLSMPAQNATVTANYAGAVVIPFPVTTHPRLWVTQGDLPRLRSWASAGNYVYSQGMAPLLAQAVSLYNTQFFPGGVQNPNYPDPGDVQGYTGYLTEQYGTILAFNSLIDPNPALRIQYAQDARNMLMVAMNQAAQGHLSGAPFRDPMFAVYNRANGSGEQWPLIVDWIYSATDAQGHAILTAADKATIRKVFMLWANDCLNAYTTGGDHPAPIGVMNDPQLLPNAQPYRMAANNYYLGHARMLTMMALSIDPADDPAVDSSKATSVLGNSLRSYILDANGAWLYQEYAMFGEPATVASAYGISGGGAGFGLASGGLPPEGMLYGHSLGFILGQLLALQTAGFNSTSYSGPQIQLIGAPIWDRYVTGYLSSMTPTAKTFASELWLGPVYQYASYGDLLRLYVTPDVMQSFSLLSLLEQQIGSQSHAGAARWLAVNACEGGAADLLNRITRPWSTTESILYYLLLDPTAAAGSDPRPTYPTTFVDPAAGRVVAHSDWSAGGTMFDYRASWISINHQLGDGGQFELFRNGEWLTKEMSNYDNNALGMTTVYHNTLALQNWCANGTPTNLQWYEAGEWANGSQWMEGLNAGDPSTVTSTGGNYVYASSDLTNLFNRPAVWTPANACMAVTQATRSILWLNKDYIVVYDRATTTKSGLFKRFNLSLVNNPAIAGRTATETLASGQQLFVQTLLPLQPSISSAYLAGGLSPIAELEPTQYVLTIEDAPRPADTRFLHVLQGADKGASMVAATYFKSVSGTAFDGAAFGSMAVFFPVNASVKVAASTFALPAGVHTVVLTGLSAKTSYGVSVSGGTLTLTPGQTGQISDAAGVLEFNF